MCWKVSWILNVTEVVPFKNSRWVDFVKIVFRTEVHEGRIFKGNLIFNTFSYAKTAELELAETFG